MVVVMSVLKKNELTDVDKGKGFTKDDNDTEEKVAVI